MGICDLMGLQFHSLLSPSHIANQWCILYTVNKYCRLWRLWSTSLTVLHHEWGQLVYDSDHMWETGNKVEEELAKDDLIVRSHNTHSCTGRPAVNSPATHGPVWWKGLSERDYSPPPPQPLQSASAPSSSSAVCTCMATAEYTQLST